MHINTRNNDREIALVLILNLYDAGMDHQLSSLL